MYFNLSPSGIHQLAVKQAIFCKNPVDFRATSTPVPPQQVPTGEIDFQPKEYGTYLVYERDKLRASRFV